MELNRHFVASEPHCPYCDAKLDGATGVTGERSPKSGDISLCAYCTQIMQFDDNLLVQTITPEREKELIDKHPEIRFWQKVLKQRDRRKD